MSKPIYKRILLKLSGEALQGNEGFGIDPSILDRMALEIKELIEMGVEVSVVGQLFRSGFCFARLRRRRDVGGFGRVDCCRSPSRLSALRR